MNSRPKYSQGLAGMVGRLTHLDNETYNGIGLEIVGPLYGCSSDIPLCI